MTTHPCCIHCALDPDQQLIDGRAPDRLGSRLPNAVPGPMCEVCQGSKRAGPAEYVAGRVLCPACAEERP